MDRVVGELGQLRQLVLRQVQLRRARDAVRPGPLLFGLHPQAIDPRRLALRQHLPAAFRLRGERRQPLVLRGENLPRGEHPEVPVRHPGHQLELSGRERGVRRAAERPLGAHPRRAAPEIEEGPVEREPRLNQRPVEKRGIAKIEAVERQDDPRLLIPGERAVEAQARQPGGLGLAQVRGRPVAQRLRGGDRRIRRERTVDRPRQREAGRVRRDRQTQGQEERHHGTIERLAASARRTVVAIWSAIRARMDGSFTSMPAAARITRAATAK